MTVEEQAQLWASSYAGANGMTAQVRTYHRYFLQ